MVGARSRLYGDGYDGFGEVDGLKEDGFGLDADGIAGGGVFEAYGGGDLACVNFLDVFAVLGVHLDDAA